MDNLEQAVFLLPPDMRAAAVAPAAVAEEFRLRCGRTPTYIHSGRELELKDCRKITADDLDGALERATGASVHSVQESVKRGFVSVKGGIRLGLCGSVIMTADGPAGIRRLSGVSIRIPREISRSCDGTCQTLMSGGFQNTIIISPPGSGKTTYLRELIRRLSDSGLRVSLADERGEVAAVWNGMPYFDVGRSTDVMSDVPKAYAAVMLMRSMNPHVLAMDEITAPGDVDAVLEAVGCGVKLLATAHAANWHEFTTRGLYKPLAAERVFKRVVSIEVIEGRRIYSVEEMA